MANSRGFTNVFVCYTVAVDLQVTDTTLCVRISSQVACIQIQFFHLLWCHLISIYFTVLQSQDRSICIFDDLEYYIFNRRFTFVVVFVCFKLQI